MKVEGRNLQRYLSSPLLLTLRPRRAKFHLRERLEVEGNFSRGEHQNDHRRLRPRVAVHPYHPIDRSHHKTLLTERDPIPDQEARPRLEEEIEDPYHLTAVEQAPILDQDLRLDAGDDRIRHIVVHRILGQDLHLHVGDDRCLKAVMQVFQLVFILDQGVPPHVGGTPDQSRRHLHVTAQGKVGDFIIGQERLLLRGGGSLEVQGGGGGVLLPE